MHRINTKRRKAVWLRFVAYAIIVVLSTVTTIALLYVALGYRLDGKSGHLVRTGLLLVENQPVDAAVYINNQLKDESAPSRFTLLAGDYQLSLKQRGYRDWNKTISIAASGVREVTYPLLIPKELSTQTRQQISAPSLVSQSNDRKFLLTHATNQDSFELFELDNDQPKQTRLQLPAAIRREVGQTGSFRVIEWALDNKHVLLEQTLPSGAKQLLSIDVTKPAEARSLNTLYGDSLLSDVHYSGEDTTAVYGIRSNNLYRFSLEKADESLVLTNIRSYQAYGNDVVLYDRLTAGNQVDIGIWQNDQATRIHSLTSDQAATKLAYAKFSDHFYFVIAEPTSGKVTIYRDPLKSPVLRNQLPFTSFALANAQRVSFSAGSQFVLVQSGPNMATYDFDDRKLYSTTLPFEVASDVSVSWLDGAYLTAQAADGANYLLEYDGQNLQGLLSSKVGAPLALSSNFEWIYRLTENESAVDLQVGSLLVR